MQCLKNTLFTTYKLQYMWTYHVFISAFINFRIESHIFFSFVQTDFSIIVLVRLLCLVFVHFHLYSTVLLFVHLLLVYLEYFAIHVFYFLTTISIQIHIFFLFVFFYPLLHAISCFDSLFFIFFFWIFPWCIKIRIIEKCNYHSKNVLFCYRVFYYYPSSHIFKFFKTQTRCIPENWPRKAISLSRSV